MMFDLDKMTPARRLRYEIRIAAMKVLSELEGKSGISKLEQMESTERAQVQAAEMVSKLAELHTLAAERDFDAYKAAKDQGKTEKEVQAQAAINDQFSQIIDGVEIDVDDVDDEL